MNLQGCSRMKCYKQEAVYNSNATIKSQYFRVMVCMGVPLE